MKAPRMDPPRTNHVAKPCHDRIGPPVKFAATRASRWGTSLVLLYKLAALFSFPFLTPAAVIEKWFNDVLSGPCVQFSILFITRGPAGTALTGPG